MLTRRLAHYHASFTIAELARLLARAGDEPTVWRATTSFACRHLGGQPIVLRRTCGPSQTTRFSARYLPTGVDAVPVFDAAASLEGMGLVPAPPAGMTGGAFREVFRSVPVANAGGLVYVQVGALDVLLLVYGGAPPLLGRPKWLLLENIAHLASGALARVRGISAPVVHPSETERTH